MAGLAAVTQAAPAFVDPVLEGVGEARWSPADWAWRRP
jgi:hypothetical protein